jgi:hypothetical protein
MSGHLVLSDLGETLKAVLWEAFQGTSLIPGDGSIGLEEPKEEGGKELKIFIFAVQEQPEMRNLPPAVKRAGGDCVVEPAPTYLMVDLLIIPSLNEAIDNLKVAGRVLQAFFERPVIRGPFLQKGLAGSSAELRVLLHPISLDDLTKLWNSFPETKFRFSLCYRVYNVPLELARAETAVAVKTTDTGYGEGVEEGGES